MRAFAASAMGAAVVAASCTSTVPTSDVEARPFFQGASAEARSSAYSTMQTALEKTLSGEPSSWQVSDREFGTLRPVETWKSQSGHWCRRYDETAFIGGVSRKREKIACRNDGRWEVVGGR